MGFHFAPLLSPHPSSENNLPPTPSVWPRRDCTWTSFERRTYWFVLKVIWYPLFQQAESWWLHYNALLMVNSTLICKRLYDKYMLFAHFILCKKKVRNLVCISSKVRIFWSWTHTFSVDKLTKNHPMVKWTPKYVFSQLHLYK